jgi:glyoxylase I family protein
MPDGQPQQPGGWNRIVLNVVDLPGFIRELTAAGLHFRNEMETGPGGEISGEVRACKIWRQ